MKNAVFEGEKTDFLKKCVEGAVSANTTPSFLRGYAVDKSRKTFHFQIALALSVRTDRDGMPHNFLHQLFTVRIGCSQELFAEHDRHFEIDLVGVNAVFRLTDNDFFTDAACEVKRRQAGVYLLLRERVGLAMQTDKTQRVLEVTERAPTEMIQFPNIRKRKGRGREVAAKQKQSKTSKIQSILAKLSHFGCLKFCLRTPFTTAFHLLYLHAAEKASR